MRQIASFFTLFWIVYFPTCIAFNDIPMFGTVDEIMTVILMAFTLMQYGKRRVTNVKPWKEYFLYLLVLAFFIYYSLMFGANVQAAVWRDMVQWIRPFSVIYCTWILNPRFTKRQKNRMLWSMIITLLLWAYQHPLGRVEYNGEMILQEFPVLGQMAMCTGMAWYIFKNDTPRNRNIAIFIMALGMLAPKFKYLGEMVCAIGLMFYTKKFNFKSTRTVVVLGVMMTVILFVTWTKFDAYFVTGFTDDVDYRLARPETYRVAFTQILWDYFPFGSGMGSWGCAAAADYYSPLYYKYGLDDVWGLMPENHAFLADAFYPTLAQIGVVGIFFFCAFWRRRLVAFNQIRDMRYYRVAWITFFCLAIEQTADTSFLSGKGMGFCMLIALCLNANRNMGYSDDGKKKLVRGPQYGGPVVRNNPNAAGAGQQNA